MYLAHHEGIVLIVCSSADDVAVCFPDHHFHRKYTSIALRRTVFNKAIFCNILNVHWIQLMQNL